MVPEQHVALLGIELHKAAVHEGVEAADVRTHPVGGQLRAGDRKAKGLVLERPVKVKSAGVEAQRAFAAYQRGRVSGQDLVLRQHADAHAALVAEVRSAHLPGGPPPLEDGPVRHQLGADAVADGMDLAVLVHLHGVAAAAAAHRVARAVHLIERAAFRAQIQQGVELFRHLPFAVEAHLRFPVPHVVVVGEQTVHRILDLLDGELAQLLGSEHPVHDHLDAALPLVEAVLGIGQIGAGDLGIVYGHAELLEQLRAAGDDGLRHAGDGAHPLGHEADIPAGGDHAQDLPQRVRVGREVLLGDHLHRRQEKAGGKTEEFVVAHDVIELLRPAGRRGELIVHAGGVVGDHHDRALFLRRPRTVCKMRVAQAVEELRHLHEQPVKPAGRRLHVRSLNPLVYRHVDLLFSRCSRVQAPSGKAMTLTLSSTSSSGMVKTKTPGRTYLPSTPLT